MSLGVKWAVLLAVNYAVGPPTGLLSFIISRFNSYRLIAIFPDGSININTQAG